MEGDGGGRLERGGEGFELFDKVSSVAAFGMTMTPTRESGKRVKDTIGKKGTGNGSRAARLRVDSKRLQSSRLPLDALVHFSPSRVGEYKSAD